jgi:hypothetical protein
VAGRALATVNGDIGVEYCEAIVERAEMNWKDLLSPRAV